MGPRQSDDARLLALEQKLTSDFEERMAKRLDREIGEIHEGIADVQKGVKKLDDDLHRNGGSVFARLDQLEKGQVRIGELGSKIERVVFDLSEVRGVKGQVEAVAHSLNEFRDECYKSVQDRDRQLGEMRDEQAALSTTQTEIQTAQTALQTAQTALQTELEPIVSVKRSLIRKVSAAAAILVLSGSGASILRQAWPLRIPVAEVTPAVTRETLLDDAFVKEFATKLAAQETLDDNSGKVSIPPGVRPPAAPRRAKDAPKPPRPGPMGWNRLADNPFPSHERDFNKWSSNLFPDFK